MPDSHFDMVRAGVLFYGIYPGSEVKRSVEVAPALKWTTRVVQSKITLPGRPVSYGSLWSPERPVRIITIPCGYGDGYFRRMSNQARVIVRGQDLCSSRPHLHGPVHGECGRRRYQGGG